MIRKKTNKGLLNLIGIELDLLSGSSSNVIILFLLSSICLVFVILLTFLSIEYAFEFIFENLIADLFLSIFISYLFGNIYVFLIHTISKDTISKNDKKRFLSLANISRLGFIVFIAFIISKPIEVYLLQNKIDPVVENYKLKIINNSNVVFQNLYAEKIKSIDYEIYKIKVENDARMIQESPGMISLINKKNEYIIELQNLINNNQIAINKSNFFITKIKILSSTFIISWVICIIVIIVFLLPVYFLYKINTNHDYYTNKSNYERNLIDKDYKLFKYEYSKIFLNKYGADISYYETYLDHPYKTIKKSQALKNQSDFINKYFTV
jgi:hypothetical protein